MVSTRVRLDALAINVLIRLQCFGTMVGHLEKKTAPKPSLEVAPTTLETFQPIVWLENFQLVVTYFSTLLFSNGQPSKQLLSSLFFSSDLELWPMTLTVEVDLDSVKVNHQAKHLWQRSFSSNVIVQTDRHTYTHETIAIPSWTIKVVGKYSELQRPLWRF